MKKTYTLFVDGGPSTGETYGSKKTAVKYGEASGKTFRVLSPSGTVVHEHTVSEPVQPEEPKKTFDLSEMKAKIAKLLAKAESTDNEHERDILNEKAEKLMLRLGIDAAELEAAGEIKPEEIIRVKREFGGNYAIVYIPFVADVANGFGNLTIIQTNYKDRLDRVAHIIGHESDVENFLTLLDSLLLQVKSALRRWQKENIEARRGLTDMVKYVQHRSFITGFGLQVNERLLALRTEIEEEASTGAALVLASKQDRVDDKAGEMFPKLKKASSTKSWSQQGLHAGAKAGSTADIGQTRVGRNEELTA